MLSIRLLPMIGHLHNHFKPVESLVTSVGGETVAIHGDYEVGVEIENRCKLAFHCVDGKCQRFPFLICEFDFIVLEIQEGGGVCAVVDRT